MKSYDCVDGNTLDILFFFLLIWHETCISNGKIVAKTLSWYDRYFNASFIWVENMEWTESSGWKAFTNEIGGCAVEIARRK